MRNVKENIGIDDQKCNAKGVSPHLIEAPVQESAPEADEYDDWDTWDQRFKALLG